jgi:hypothetical protein
MNYSSQATLLLLLLLLLLYTPVDKPLTGEYVDSATRLHSIHGVALTDSQITVR